MVDLDAIRARADAATPGPWGTLPGLHPWEVCIAADIPLVELSHSEQGKRDAAFIAAARTDVPALLAEVDRLRAELAERDRQAAANAAMATDEIRGLLIQALADHVTEIEHGEEVTR